MTADRQVRKCVACLVLLVLIIDVVHTITVKSESESHTQGSKYKSLKLKNINPHQTLSNISNVPPYNSTEYPEENPDAEQIFLPLDGRHIHSDKVLERLAATNAPSLMGTTFDEALLDFSAYLTKPFVFDYSKALNDAVEQAKSEVISTNYNLDDSKFEGANLEQSESQEHESKPTENYFTETLSDAQTNDGPRTEKLVRNLSSGESSSAFNFDETKLPLGFAFFEALREQNNRPYFQAFAQTTPRAQAYELTTQKPAVATTIQKEESFETTTTDYSNDKEVDLVTVNPTSFYRRRNSEKSDDYENKYFDSEGSKNEKVKPYFRGFISDNSNHDSPESSAEDQDHSSYQSEDDSNHSKEESQEAEEEPKYEYKVTNTKSYGTKPGMKFNKYSRLKLLQQQKPSTKAKPAKLNKKDRSPKKSNSVASATINYSITHDPPKKASLSNRGSARFLYDDEVYHPSESREFRIVVTPPPADLSDAASAQHLLLQAPPRFGQFKPSRQLDVDTFKPITTKPVVAPRPTQPAARKPSMQKPPQEMRYFQ